MSRCPAEQAIERIRKDKTLTDTDWFEFEVFYRVCSKHCSELGKLLNGKAVKERYKKDAMGHPTIQEEDRKSFWSKRRKK